MSGHRDRGIWLREHGTGPAYESQIVGLFESLVGGLLRSIVHPRRGVCERASSKIRAGTRSLSVHLHRLLALEDSHLRFRAHGIYPGRVGNLACYVAMMRY